MNSISTQYLINAARLRIVPGRSQEQINADCKHFVMFLSGFIHGVCPDLALALDELSSSSLDGLEEFAGSKA
ncbi:hypothetical protein [Undibacterium sp. Ren11W]|uniref:hypothetical protein n=1 Tax=Undibacterium sp. Ren11W TaxID=3413045 RepID=UPI003BF0D269